MPDRFDEMAAKLWDSLQMFYNPETAAEEEANDLTRIALALRTVHAEATAAERERASALADEIEIEAHGKAGHNRQYIGNAIRQGPAPSKPEER